MLQLQNVIKCYKTKAGIVKAVDGISLTFPAAGLVFITGKSGCGKTTLLNIIGGLDGIDGGEILVQDKKFSTFSPTEYDSYRNTFIGFIFQEYNLLPEFTVEKNIKMAMELQGVSTDEEAFEKLLQDVGIEDLKSRTPAELSGGQRQRVAIARALVKQPRIIMADEPTGALDSATGIQVLETLKRLSKDKLVIVVSHDCEFAEKYADRIIHLVDGKVAEDVSFTERELCENVNEQEDKLLVREGADLSEAEKDMLAKAVKERKPISLLKTLFYRNKKPTGEIKHDTSEPVALTKSQMKLKSAVLFGVKSLAVKKVRLVLTILISALAFAVFGLFDTIANFSAQRVLQNFLKDTSSEAITTTASFVVDYEEGDRYAVNVSDEILSQFSKQTRGTVKGVTEGYSITELYSSKASLGKKYYTQKTNGFIEFNSREDIDDNGKFKGFGYKLVAGSYPAPVYKNGTLDEVRMTKIAISTYFADSILHHLQGAQLNDKNVVTRDDLLNAQITIDGDKFTIVGLIDCGAIPSKYDSLKTSTSYNVNSVALINDFTSYIDAGAHKCIFVGTGFIEERAKSNIRCDVGNTEWTLAPSNNTTKKSVESYAYPARRYNEDNILLFSGEYAEDGKINLASDEILIHVEDLLNLFSADISKLDSDTSRMVKSYINSMNSYGKEDNRTYLDTIFEKLDNRADSYPVTVVQKYTETGKSVTKALKIVGVYFGVDVDSYKSPVRYKLMVSDALMQELNIYPYQGYYQKILFSTASVKNGLKVIANYATSENGLVLSLYNNSVLSVIKENETMIKQVADLFLYAAMALALLAIFLLYNYINTSISGKKQSVGVLRGLGACGKDIFLTFLSESIIIAIINGVLANIFAAVGCLLVNWYVMNIMNISIEFALFGIRQVLVISAISVLTALVSSAIPIYNIAKKKPVELIRRP